MSKIILSGLIVSSIIVFGCAAQQAPQPIADAVPEAWREAEQGILADWVQLTFSDRFVKAGESYFSPDDSRIIFQAVEKPQDGRTPDDFYAMFVADVRRDAQGNITGLDDVRRISPAGSANTCGWFHPTRPNVVIFASTIGKPAQQDAPGFRRGGQYVWMFPPEMRIVECDLTKADGTAETLKTIAGDGTAYTAEGSVSPDGRRLLYSSTESGEGDLFILDLQTGRKTRIVQARGYDGGPFFSPDGKRICYRSDRDNDNLLQLFVADLAFNDQGEIIGVEREYQLTDESCVNWCPYWTRDGRRLIYASSALGEQNFEIYMTDADPGNLTGSDGTIRYGSARRRITHFEQANAVPASDVLPALSQDGKWMIWTSRRGPDSQVHLWAARFVLDPDAPWKKSPPSAGPPPAPQPQRTAQDQIVVEDPDTGRIFVYDTATHKLSEYDPRTHQLSEITDPADIERFRKLHAEQKKKQP
jgi:TolB protein